MSAEVAAVEPAKENEAPEKEKEGLDKGKDTSPPQENEESAKEIIEPKSDDKKDIEVEEREKMLNEENKKEGGEVEKKKKALEEAVEREAGRKRIPIGGIKIPGFLKSRSKDKSKVRIIKVPFLPTTVTDFNTCLNKCLNKCEF